MKLLVFFITFMIFYSLKAEDYTLKKYKNDPLRTCHYTLKNGLQVFLTENHEKPVFKAEVVIRAGGSQDPADSTGIAHYLEHMLFKGTDRFGTVNYAKEKQHLDNITALYEEHLAAKSEKQRAAIMDKISQESEKASVYAIPNEFDRMYQEMGATGVNAFTSVDETVYTVECPSNSLNKWCLIEAERFRNPVFRLFQTEIEAVYEEKNGSLDSKGSALYEAFLRQMFKRHPYGQQTILGSVEHLKSPSIKQMYEFYNRYYLPNNMAIVISGDINPTQAIKEISRYFSNWQPSQLPEAKKVIEEKLNGEEIVEVEFPGEEQLMLGFRIPLSGHKDEYALKMIDMILDNSQAGLINVNLNQALKVKSAGSYRMMFNDGACHVFYGVPLKDQKLEEVKKLILEQIEKIKAGDFEEWLLSAILADFKKSEQGAYEFNNGRVSALRDLFVAGQSVDKLVVDLEELSKVTKEDAVRVANLYYGSDYVVAYRRDKKTEKIKMTKPKFKKIKADAGRESLFSKRVKLLPVKAVEPTYVDFKKDLSKGKVSEGVVLYHTENPVNNLFDFSINIPVGKRHEPLLPLLADLFNEGGWENKAPEEISNSFYKKAASFSMVVSNNETVVSLTGLDDEFEATFNLLYDHLNNFATTGDRVKATASMIVDSREKQKKEPSYLSYALANYSRYKDKSPFLTGISTKKLLETKPVELREALNELLKTEMKLSYTGRKSLDDVTRVVKKVESQKKRAPVKIELKSTDPEKPFVNFINFDSVQTYIRMEFPGDYYEIKDQAIYMLFNEYFDGSLGSVVFQEIREKKALAYSAWARYFPREEKGLRNLMICGLTTQADKTIDAITAFHEIVYNFPFEDRRFEVAKEAVIKQLNSRKISFRERLGMVQKWEDLGMDNEDPNKMFLSQIKNMKLKDLKGFVKSKIYGKKFAISVVGDAERIDLKKLNKFGTVKILKKEDIFKD